MDDLLKTSDDNDDDGDGGAPAVDEEDLHRKIDEAAGKRRDEYLVSIFCKFNRYKNHIFREQSEFLTLELSKVSMEISLRREQPLKQSRHLRLTS